MQTGEFCGLQTMMTLMMWMKIMWSNNFPLDSLFTALYGDNGDTLMVDKVTSLDSPGHAAFNATRQCDSNGTDVIVLVIAANDGISPQMVEIIECTNLSQKLYWGASIEKSSFSSIMKKY